MQAIDRPARKLILKQGIKATHYFEYCEEVGCDTLEERLDGKGINMSLDRILEELGRCKINIISSKNNVLKRATITKMSDS